MDKRSFKYLIWGRYYSFIVTGLAVLITGAILPYLRQEFGITYDQGGLLLALQAIGNLTASFAGGFISDYIGRKAMLAIGSLFFVIGFGGVLLVHSAFMLIAFLFIAGLGWGTLNNLVNAVVSDATQGNGSIMNMLHMFFGIGAFSAPFLVGLSVRIGLGWRLAVLALVIAAALLCAVFLLMPIPQAKDKNKMSLAAFRAIKDGRFILFMALLFFYVGTENSINGWFVTYLIDRNLFSAVDAQNMLSIFWIALIIGRLICSYLARIYSKEIVIAVCSAGGFICLILLLTADTSFAILLLAFAVGLFLSGIYPTVVANASSLIAGSGTASGMMLSFGGLGGAVVPYIDGIVAKGNGISAGMSVVGISAFILVAAATANLIMGLKRSRKA